MAGLFHRAIDVALIVLGAFGALHLNVTAAGAHYELDSLLVAFVAALALSVFPACGTYPTKAQIKRSVVSSATRTAIAWLVVQMCGLALLYLIQRTSVLSVPWFLYWTLTSGILLLVAHTLTVVAFNIASQLRQRVVTADGMPVQRVYVSLGPTAASQTVKRGFDVVVGLALLIALSPLLAVIALAVRRDGGPVVFGHVRVGLNGRRFRCLKFRSMVVNADQVLKQLLETDPQARAEWEREFKLKNDVRVTPIGRFLRRTSLDELPQLWNVVRGDMSLVGPRPVIDQELERYGADVDYYLMAKPGMTGLWQVSGRSDTDYATRVSLDVAYVKNWSLARDITILFKTFKVVVYGSGAY
ncbi:exopolysaccharide biosynthesis polyprenyl glycosylphosphotransferase [Paraburkholderia rhizosphaerae]|nr:exopolysaccharide biosynthesis polyprenyl glycosylphosphotransferase [Paraburkholderia rhizosphaerae]